MTLADLLKSRPSVGQKAAGEIPKPARRYKPPAPQKPRQPIGQDPTDPARLAAKRAEERAWKLKRAAAFVASGGKCVVGRPNCTKKATEGHHVLGRGVGGNSETSECLPTCWNCHDFLTRNRTWAYENGLLEKSWAADARAREAAAAPADPTTVDAKYVAVRGLQGGTTGTGGAA